MAIIEKNGFKFLSGLNSQYIVIESNRLEQYLNYIKNNEISSIYISSLYFLEDNIDFLLDLIFVKKINISATSIKNYDGLKHLKNLKELILSNLNTKVDLSNNIFLETLSIDLDKKIVGLEKLSSLKKFKIWKYKPKSRNLTELSNLSSIEELTVTQSTITSLKGCGKFKNLKKLELNYINKLEFIDQLELNADILKSLRIDNCKKIKNHNYVSCLKELELLSFCDCDKISTIEFIRNLPKLKQFMFVNTNVIDGDLSPCLGLEYVGFSNKRHYSHKCEDFVRKNM
ncbi:hypothetical protein [Oceanirhabdus sp. W0125-5]|uniref:hypothetical protein n=1 Tax=Oceanirhabdus sp. W0125-5 TaxID=2999116 RepID=UPI0022F2AC36|nr:hypothetical protein [Oceanirhabdus sp. W0125-5]WBW97206.1 hypothetical protein OW730_26485 [Oceanirhabdus sp. W0125-5]